MHGRSSRCDRRDGRSRGLHTGFRHGGYHRGSRHFQCPYTTRRTGRINTGACDRRVGTSETGDRHKCASRCTYSTTNSAWDSSLRGGIKGQPTALATRSLITIRQGGRRDTRTSVTRAWCEKTASQTNSAYRWTIIRKRIIIRVGCTSCSYNTWYTWTWYLSKACTLSNRCCLYIWMKKRCYSE